MKKIITCMFLLSSCMLFSNNTITLSGNVLDNKNFDEIPFATLVLKSNNKIVQGTYSDIEGYFVFENIVPGNYIVSCLFLGYKTVDLKVQIKEVDIRDLNFLLSEISYSITCVEIVEYKANINRCICGCIDKTLTSENKNKTFSNRKNYINNRNSSYKIAPNPSYDITNLHFSESIRNIIISDINGKSVRQFNDVKEYLSINTSSLISGTYFITFIDNHRKGVTDKLIVIN